MSVIANIFLNTFIFATNASYKSSLPTVTKVTKSYAKNTDSQFSGKSGLRLSYIMMNMRNLAILNTNNLLVCSAGKDKIMNFVLLLNAISVLYKKYVQILNVFRQVNFLYAILVKINIQSMKNQFFHDTHWRNHLVFIEKFPLINMDKF